MILERIIPTITDAEGWHLEPHLFWTDVLQFPVEVSGVVNPFRRRVLNYIYRLALSQSRGLLKYALVEAVNEPNDQDSFYLNLAMAIDMDWDDLDQLYDQILAGISQWSRDEWDEDQQKEYSHWIYFSLTPFRV